MSRGKIICSLLALSFGTFMIVYGERDDSPGAQFLGLVLVSMGIFWVTKSGKKNSD